MTPKQEIARIQRQTEQVSTVRAVLRASCHDHPVPIAGCAACAESAKWYAEYQEAFK